MKRSKGFRSTPGLTAASFVAVAALAGASALAGSPTAAASGVPTSGSQAFVGTISSSSIDLIGFGIASFSDDPWTSLTITNKTTESQRIVALAPPYEMRYNGPPVGAQLQPGEAMIVSVSPDTVVTMSQDHRSLVGTSGIDFR